MPGANQPPTTDDRFNALIERILATRKAKGSDYGDRGDSLANLRAASELGIEPFLGVLLRMSDKWSRIKNLARKGGRGAVTDESITDTLQDLSVYALLAILLWEDRSTRIEISADDKMTKDLQDAAKTVERVKRREEFPSSQVQGIPFRPASKLVPNPAFVNAVKDAIVEQWGAPKDIGVDARRTEASEVAYERAKEAEAERERIAEFTHRNDPPCRAGHHICGGKDRFRGCCRENLCIFHDCDSSQCVCPPRVERSIDPEVNAMRSVFDPEETR